MSLSHDDLLELVQHRNSTAAENKAALREMINADVERFLANGGQVESAVSVTLRCEPRIGAGVDTTDRRWAVKEYENKIARRRAHALKRWRTVLPGSGEAVSHPRVEGELKETRSAARLAGDRYYDSKRACERGHFSPRYAQNGTCVECARILREKLRSAA